MEKCINWPALKMRQLRAILKATMTCMRKVFIGLDVKGDFVRRISAVAVCMAYEA